MTRVGWLWKDHVVHIRILLWNLDMLYQLTYPLDFSRDKEEAPLENICITYVIVAGEWSLEIGASLIYLETLSDYGYTLPLASTKGNGTAILERGAFAAP